MTQIEFLQKVQVLRIQMHENKKNYDNRLTELARQNKQLVDEENENFAGCKQQHKEILDNLADKYHEQVRMAKDKYHDDQHTLDQAMADLKIEYVTEHPNENPNQVF